LVVHAVGGEVGLLDLRIDGVAVHAGLRRHAVGQRRRDPCPARCRSVRRWALPAARHHRCRRRPRPAPCGNRCRGRGSRACRHWPGCWPARRHGAATDPAPGYGCRTGFAGRDSSVCSAGGCRMEPEASCMPPRRNPCHAWPGRVRALASRGRRQGGVGLLTRRARQSASASAGSSSSTACASRSGWNLATKASALTSFTIAALKMPLSELCSTTFSRHSAGASRIARVSA